MPIPVPPYEMRVVRVVAGCEESPRLHCYTVGFMAEQYPYGQEPMNEHPQGSAQEPYGTEPTPVRTYAEPQYGQPSAQPYGQPSAQPYGQTYSTPQYGEPQAPQYTQTQIPPAAPQPPYGQVPPQGMYGMAEPHRKWNVMCIVGFILSFIIAPAGLIISIIALVQINKSHEKSKGMAIAGIVIGAVMTVLSVLSIWLVFWAVNEVSDHPEWINVNGTVCKNGKCTVCHNGDCQVCDEDECDMLDFDSDYDSDYSAYREGVESPDAATLPFQVSPASFVTYQVELAH